MCQPFRCNFCYGREFVFWVGVSQNIFLSLFNTLGQDLFLTMEKQRLIFVTNDDGYAAKGFAAAIEVAREFGRVVAVAPAEPQSGRSQAITMYDPLFLEQRHKEEGLEIYSFTGTPVDCVKWTFDHLLVDEKVDLVISGINHGSNSAINVHYSGTMGIVIEGCMKGIPSIGFSLDNHSPEANFEPCAPYIVKIVEQVLERGLPEGSCLNVNFPATPIYEGVKVCRMARGEWTQEWEEHPHPRG